MKFAITSTEYDNAYNAAFEAIEQEYGEEAFEDCGGMEGWAGDILCAFIDEFLRALGIHEIRED